MTDASDPLDEVIRVEAVADWCVAPGRAAMLCTRAAEDAGAAEDAEDAEDAWRRATDDDRLRAIAATPPAAGPIEEATARLRSAIAFAVWIGVATAAVFGAFAVAAALPASRETPTNLFWMLAGVLGVQTGLLLLWIVVAIGAPRWRSGGIVGWIVGRVARRLVRRAAVPEREVDAPTVADGPDESVAMALVVRRRGRIEVRTPLARWGAGAITNSMWAIFNLAGLATALVLLGSRQYEFAWESTILGPDRYVAIIDAIAWLPRRLGFVAPDAAAIAASRFDPTDPTSFPAQSDELRAAWSGLLVGAVVAYGLLPRLLLAGFCLWSRHRARRRLRVDPLDPAVAALLEAARRAAPPPPAASPVDLPSTGPGVADDASIRRPSGPPALAGLEIETPPGGWPPVLDREIVDLGIVASGGERRRAAVMLASAPHRPSMLVAVCDGATTPDRGVASTIRSLARAAASPTLMVISRGEHLRRREAPATVAQRLADWRRLAEDLDASLLEIDLDHLTGDSRRRLAEALDDTTTGALADTNVDPSRSSSAGPPSGFAEAIRAIVAAARRWHDETGSPRLPTASEEADLHRRIVRIFEGDGEIARWPFPPLSPSRPADSLRRAASRIESMLPASLRVRPKWLAAGAAAGALGCIAAATLISPLAISALPVWAGIGGAVTGLLSARSPGSDAGDRHDDGAAVDFGPAVATALLQAVLLAHQGRGETAIGAALDAAIDADEPSRLPDADAVAAWCGTVEARLAAFDRGGPR
jgi:hypothetical protein